jgi:hypothetical protein
MYQFEDDEDIDNPNPVPFRPNHKMHSYDDLEGSGFDGFGMYGTYYDEDFTELANDNFRLLVSPLDELEDLDNFGNTLEYRGRGTKKK